MVSWLEFWGNWKQQTKQKQVWGCCFVQYASFCVSVTPIATVLEAQEGPWRISALSICSWRCSGDFCFTVEMLSVLKFRLTLEWVKAITPTESLPPSGFKTRLFPSHKHHLQPQQVRKVLAGSTRSLLRRHFGETILLMENFKNKGLTLWSHLAHLSTPTQAEVTFKQCTIWKKKMAFCVESCVSHLFPH